MIRTNRRRQRYLDTLVDKHLSLFVWWSELQLLFTYASKVVIILQFAASLLNLVKITRGAVVNYDHNTFIATGHKASHNHVATSVT